MYHRVRVEVRGQSASTGSFLPPWGSRDWTQVPSLGGNHLYPLSHLASLPRKHHGRGDVKIIKY